MGASEKQQRRVYLIHPSTRISLYVQDKNQFSATEIGSLPELQSTEDCPKTLNKKHRRRSIMGTQG